MPSDHIYTSQISPWISEDEVSNDGQERHEPRNISQKLSLSSLHFDTPKRQVNYNQKRSKKRQSVDVGSLKMNLSTVGIGGQWDLPSVYKKYQKTSMDRKYDINQNSNKQIIFQNENISTQIKEYQVKDGEKDEQKDTSASPKKEPAIQSHKVEVDMDLNPILDLTEEDSASVYQLGPKTNWNGLANSPKRIY